MRGRFAPVIVSLLDSIFSEFDALTDRLGLEKIKTFAITSVTHAAETYRSGDNHDPDGDTDGTTIAVPKL
jgi:hypothetical protein